MKQVVFQDAFNAGTFANTSSPISDRSSYCVRSYHTLLRPVSFAQFRTSRTADGAQQTGSACTSLVIIEYTLPLDKTSVAAKRDSPNADQSCGACFSLPQPQNTSRSLFLSVRHVAFSRSLIASLSKTIPYVCARRVQPAQPNRALHALCPVWGPHRCVSSAPLRHAPRGEFHYSEKHVVSIQLWLVHTSRQGHSNTTRATEVLL